MSSRFTEAFVDRQIDEGHDCSPRGVDPITVKIDLRRPGDATTSRRVKELKAPCSSTRSPDESFQGDGIRTGQRNCSEWRRAAGAGVAADTHALEKDGTDPADWRCDPDR